jgi:superfamily II DNA or RNA helicase
MFDGSLKPVEHIEIGDLLMGPDSKSREVLRLISGKQPMVRITPTKGEPFVVNKDHLLFLKVMQQSSTDARACFQSKNEVVSVEKYMNGAKWYRHIRKLQRNPVEFPEKSLILDPYFLGLMLGDGSMCNGVFSYTSQDQELHDYFWEYTKTFGCTPKNSQKENNKAWTSTAPHPLSNRTIANPITTLFRELDLQEKRAWDKQIPRDYKTCGKNQRLKLLAGLLDSDGYFNPKGDDLSFNTTSKLLAEDVQFIARSLGFGAYIKQSHSFIGNQQYRDNYNVSLSGDFSVIPFLRKRHIKLAKPRIQKKNVLVTGFKTELLSEDNYYGFTISDDNLYLDSQFIIHHNCGKSVIISMFLMTAFYQYQNQKVLVLTHVKELIVQNFKELLGMWPQAPAGINSAALNQRDYNKKIIFAGIASIHKDFEKFGKVDLILIDEAHLVNPNESTMYKNFIEALMSVNPYLKIIGFTATPWRMGHGRITENGIFTDFCYDITDMKSFNRLIAEGYMASLIPKQTKLILDTTGVKLGSDGDFAKGELQLAVDKYEITIAALKEAIELGSDRKSWLIFGSGIEHCNHIAEILSDLGVECRPIHSKMKDTIRDQNIADFKSGKLRAIVNNNVLTTGFNHKAIDLIIVLRPTTSVNLWVQLLGRGTRPSPETSKENCIAEGELVLTDIGLIPIEKITLNMKLWDGEEFVSHEGLINKGEQNVIKYSGLTATADHKVWTKKGWETFGNCSIKQTPISVTGIGKQNIQQSKNYYRSCNSQKTGLYGGSVLNMSKTVRKRIYKLNKIRSWLQALRNIEGWKPRYATLAGKSLYICTAKMLQQERSKVSGLWWARNNIQLLRTNCNGCLYSGNIRLTQGITIGPNKERIGLSTWKFKVCEANYKYEQPTGKKSNCKNTRIQNKISRDSICGHNFSRILSFRNDRRANNRTLPHEIKKTKRRVWDIRNAGPRNRFTVSGLLVSNCLVLDFAGNTKRLGPINDPVIPKKKGEKQGTAPVKLCQACDCYNHASVRVCSYCDAEFSMAVKITEEAGGLQLIKGDLPQIEEFKVDTITYVKHSKIGARDSMKVSYYCGLRVFTEYICVEHEGFAKNKANEWWKKRGGGKSPPTVLAATYLTDTLLVPSHIVVWVNKKYPEIMNVKFENNHKVQFQTHTPEIEGADVSTLQFESGSKDEWADYDDNIPY